jgi:molybdate transport system regulatory protein
MSRLFLRIYLTPTQWIGPGKVQLLEAIRETGSISAAARTMDMSYRRAWLLVDALNATFDQVVVATSLGGRGGGAAVLTPFGADIVARYRASEAAAWRAVRATIAPLERRVRQPSRARRIRSA